MRQHFAVLLRVTIGEGPSLQALAEVEIAQQCALGPLGGRVQPTIVTPQDEGVDDQAS